jgi:hypothetical protein
MPTGGSGQKSGGRGTAHKRTRISQTYESSAVEINLEKIVFLEKCFAKDVTSKKRA